jgi:hypothetical protein
MAKEIRYAVPYLSALSWTLNPMTPAVPVSDQYGNRGFQTIKEDPAISIDIIGFIADEPIGPTKYKFEGANYEAMATALASIKETWGEAFDALLEEFSITKDQAPEMAAVGLPYTLRLDRWDVNFTPGSANDVKAIVGVYDDEECAKVVAYKVLTFLDGNSQRARVNTRAQIVARIDQVTLAPASDQRTAELAQLNAQLARFDKEELQIGSLPELLANPVVIQSVGQLCATLFTTLKATDSKWAGLDVEAVMALFALPEIQ